MNQPAPDWPAAPAAEAAPPIAPPAPMAAPTLVAAPDAPAYAPAAPAALQFAPPASPEAALDVTAPLMPVGMPAAPAAPAAPAPAYPAAPAMAAAAPDASAYPASLAMPQVEEGPAIAAMPTFASSMDAAPHPIGGVTAAHPADLADRAAGSDPEIEDVAVPSADPTGTWWSPGNALVLAVAGLVTQLVAFYTREQLPLVKQSGTDLTNFDNVVGSVPLIDGIVGQALGPVLAAGALFMLLYGSRRGLREPQLQVAIGIVATLALLALPLLPILAG